MMKGVYDIVRQRSNNVGIDDEASSITFDMDSLRIDLPAQKRRGLSKYYSGKSRSFKYIAENDHQIHCIEDLKKKNKKQQVVAVLPDPADNNHTNNNKKRRKYLFYAQQQQQPLLLLPPPHPTPHPTTATTPN